MQRAEFRRLWAGVRGLGCVGWGALAALALQFLELRFQPLDLSRAAREMRARHRRHVS